MFFNQLDTNSTTALQALPASKRGKVYADVPLNYFANVENLKNYVVELKKLMEENRKKHQEKEEQRIKNYEAVEKAKKEGKKVEMVWDKESKTVKPMIVEEKGGKA